MRVTWFFREASDIQHLLHVNATNCAYCLLYNVNTRVGKKVRKVIPDQTPSKPYPRSNQTTAVQALKANPKPIPTI